MSVQSSWDVIVVGAGHAGVEAGLAAARMGARTAMLTLDRTSVGRMSCNPAIGGLAKGHLVREIDALGGQMGRAIDEAGIQFRMLNTRKGPAVWGPRAQADRREYNAVLLREVLATPNLDLVEGEATAIVRNDAGAIRGLRLATGETLATPTLILATGTFLAGRMLTGKDVTSGGRRGEPGAALLTQSLREAGLRVGRLKTGTSPRIRRSDLDIDDLERQPGDDRFRPFSHFTAATAPSRPQQDCWLTRTSAETHEIVRRNLHRSPVAAGAVEGKGPRYCPSLEEKVVRFPEVESHLLFLEPEGGSTDEIYVNGLSMSLPVEVQTEVLRSIPGIRATAFPLHAGYTVEYDFVDPTQLRPSLECRTVPGLYLAGQINGTTGYEEAAAQGLVAGVNAVRCIRGEGVWSLGRDEAYTGVLIDDLITKGTDEPYRMFTSRAEHRLHLRQDNADERLLGHARELELLSPTDLDHLDRRVRRVNELERKLGAERLNGTSALEYLARPQATLRDWEAKVSFLQDYSLEERERVEVRVKYRGYLEREQRRITKHRDLEGVRIPEEIEFSGLIGVSYEGREKLARIRPLTVGQASRISGVSPADIGVLLVALRRNAS